MSKMAKDQARKLKRTPDANRMIICEQVFDVRIGEMVIIAFHPESNTSLPLLRESLPDRYSREFDLALRKAIWREALKYIPKHAKHIENPPAVSIDQPALF